ncbi:hypothetical protein C8J56DRAFT_1044510 [Mycena floridula]|nr:hypothetical protein C8J56DRAFT_1044510 [Mycena floridula]
MSTQEMVPPFQHCGLIQCSPVLPHSPPVSSNFAQSGSNVLHPSDSFDPNHMVAHHSNHPALSTYSMLTPSYTAMDFVPPGPSSHWFIPSQNVTTAPWISPANVQAQSTAGPSHFSNVEHFSFPSISNLYTVPVELDIPGAQIVDDPRYSDACLKTYHPANASSIPSVSQASVASHLPQSCIMSRTSLSQSIRPPSIEPVCPPSTLPLRAPVTPIHRAPSALLPCCVNMAPAAFELPVGHDNNFAPFRLPQGPNLRMPPVGIVPICPMTAHQRCPFPSPRPQSVALPNAPVLHYPLSIVLNAFHNILQPPAGQQQNQQQNAH